MMRRGVDWSKAALKGEIPSATEGGLPTPFAGLAARPRTPVVSGREVSSPGRRVSTCGSGSSFSWSECTAREQRSRNGGDLPGVFASLGKARAGVQERSVWTGLEKRVTHAMSAAPPQKNQALERRDRVSGNALNYPCTASVRNNQRLIAQNAHGSGCTCSSEPESHTGSSGLRSYKPKLLKGAARTARVSAMPGSHYTSDLEADAKNDYITHLADSIDVPRSRLSIPVRLNPPSGWLDGDDGADPSGCASSMKGSVDECVAFVAPLDLLDYSDSETYASHLNFKNGTDDEQEIIKYVWAYLCHNTDLIRWTLCWVGDSDGEWYDCIQGHLFADWPWRLNIRFDADSGSTSEGLELDASVPAYSSDVIGGTIKINRDAGTWKDALSAWNIAGEGMLGCIAVYWAGVLLHELIHVCNYHHSVEDYLADGVCDFAELVGETFRWALHQRFPDSCSACCGCRDTEFGDARGEYSFGWIDGGGICV